MITLYSFGKNLGVADPSPFVLKIDAYLRMAGIEFTSLSGINNLQKAPKGKLPFIDDDGVKVSDSFFILQYVKNKYGDNLDAHLSDEQKAISNLIVKSLDENFYWCIVHSRWIQEESWPTIKNTFFGRMPFPLRLVVPSIARIGVKNAIVKHGMGKHSDEEIIAIAENTLKSLSVLLSDKTYFFGDSPSTIDAVAFAFLAQVTLTNLNTPLNQVSKKYDNLVRFCNNINNKYY